MHEPPPKNQTHAREQANDQQTYTKQGHDVTGRMGSTTVVVREREIVVIQRGEEQSGELGDEGEHD